MVIIWQISSQQAHLTETWNLGYQPSHFKNEDRTVNCKILEFISAGVSWWSCSSVRNMVSQEGTMNPNLNKFSLHVTYGGGSVYQTAIHVVVGCWHCYQSEARCRFAYAQLMPVPLTVSCSSKSRLVLPSWFGFTFLVAAGGSPGWSGHSPEEPQNNCVCV